MGDREPLEEEGTTWQQAKAMARWRNMGTWHWSGYKPTRKRAGANASRKGDGDGHERHEQGEYSSAFVYRLSILRDTADTEQRLGPFALDPSSFVESDFMPHQFLTLPCEYCIEYFRCSNEERASVLCRHLRRIFCM